MRRRSCVRALTCLAVGGFLISLAGCGESATSTTETAVAKSSLTTALDAWKQGKTPQDLKAGTPEIVMGDEAWDSGKKLTSYQFDGKDFDDGKNLHCTVKLQLDGVGEQAVTYVVGTTPVITIFRR